MSRRNNADSHLFVLALRETMTTINSALSPQMEDITYRLPTDVPSRISLSTSSKLATAARLAAAKLPPSINWICFADDATFARIVLMSGRSSPSSPSSLFPPALSSKAFLFGLRSNQHDISNDLELFAILEVILTWMISFSWPSAHRSS
jgi:hypothetical protein